MSQGMAMMKEHKAPGAAKKITEGHKQVEEGAKKIIQEPSAEKPK